MMMIMDDITLLFKGVLVQRSFVGVSVALLDSACSIPFLCAFYIPIFWWHILLARCLGTYRVLYVASSTFRILPQVKTL